MRHAVVVCDVGPAYGSGHAMRCLALAEELISRGTAVTYLADVASVRWVHERVAALGAVVVAPPSDPDALPSAVVDLGADAVVVDSYHLAPGVYAALRATGLPTLAFVDQHLRGADADLLLDANIGSDDDVVELPDGTRRLAGLDYALIRRDVREHRPPSPQRLQGSGARPRVLGIFGGTDPAGAGVLVADALVRTGLAFEATIVAPRPELVDAVHALAPGPGQALHTISPTDRLPALVAESDVVLSAAGTSTWELLCLGAATGLVCTADNQTIGYARALDAGVGLGVGDVADDGFVEAAVRPLRRLLTETDLRSALSSSAWRTVDGRGASRVADALESLG
ncbi:PseG/SpsG family protein [Solicola sp. PLA-1-18]|uniref:PseG/SpsG family protein n=1 Tax=Solicola sp. PLA-1-18 TaxID=3380532 RepID=UPI003B7941B8